MDINAYGDRSPTALDETSNKKQEALNQVSELKKVNQVQVSQNIEESLDPVKTRMNDLNELSFEQYQYKYGFDAATSREYATNTFNTKVVPQVAAEQQQALIDSTSTGDVIVDAGLAGLAGAVNMVGGGAGLGLAVASDPLGAVSAGVSTVGDLAAAFVGDDTDYESLILGDQGNVRSDGIFAEAAENVEKFLAEQGEPTERELNVLDVESGVDKLPQLLKNAAGLVFEGTKAVSEWIKTGQSDSLNARTAQRAQENDEYVAKLKEDLGEDSGWVDNAQKNSKILGNAFLNLASDPIAGITMIVESLPTLIGAGSIAKQIGDKSLDTAIKKKTQSIIDEVKAKDLPHNVTQALIKANLKDVKAPTTGAIGLTNAAAVGAGVLEGSGAASEAYNLIVDTDFNTLGKVSERYNTLINEGNSPEDARKALAIESSLGAGIAVTALAGGISKISGSTEGINRAYGTVKTADGFIPRAVQVAQDAGREGIEETFQSFISSAATGTVKQANVDANTDIGAEASIAAGEGALAGVGTSGLVSTARSAGELVGVFSKGVNTATKGTRERLQQSATVTRKAKEIKESGVKESDVDVTSDDFNFTATVRGLASRNLKEGISEEEIESNISATHEVINDYLDQVDSMQKLIDEGKVSPDEAKELATKIDTALDDITAAYNTVDSMEQRQIDPESLKDDVELATKGDTDATTRVMGNMAKAPSTVSEEQAQSLIDSGSLTPAQQEQAEAHIQVKQDAKTLDEVHSDVMIGGKGFIGIKQYLDAIGSALRANKEASAQKSFDGLSRFATRHAQKAADYSEALFLVQQPNKTPEQLSRIAELNRQYPNADKTKDTFHNGSGRSQKFIDTVDKIGFEANALANAVKLAGINMNATQEAPVETSTETDTNVPVQDEVVSEEVTETPVVEEESIQTTEPEVTNEVVNDAPPWETDSDPKKTTEDLDLPPWDIEEDVTKPTNAKQVLQEALDNGLYAGKARRIIAKAIVKFIPEHVTFQFVPENSEKLFNPATNQYHPAMHYNVGEVYVSDALSKELQEENLLHELIHSVLVPAYRGKGNKTPEQKKFINEIQRLHKFMVKQAKKDGISEEGEIAYGLSNVDEFLAMSMSNPRFMQWMSDTKIDTRTVFTRFAQAVAELLGLPKNSYSALENLLDITDQVLNNEQVSETSIPNEYNQMSDKQLKTIVLNEEAEDGSQISDRFYEAYAELQERYPDALDINDMPDTTTPPVANKEQEVGQVSTESTIEYQEESEVSTEYESSPSKEARYKAFIGEDLVQKYFAVPNKQGSTTNPLMEIGNFLAELAARPEQNITNYTNIKEITPKQVDLVNQLEDHHKDFSEIANNIYDKKNFPNQDMIQFFYKEDGTFDPQLLEAMSVASYNWIATGAGGTIYNSVDDIRRMLNLTESDEIPTEALTYLSTGSFRGDVASELGKAALKAMSLKSIKTAPGNMQSQLENSIGLLAVAALNKQGMIIVESIPNTVNLKGEARERFEELAGQLGTDPQYLKTVKSADAKELLKILNTTSAKVTAFTEHLEGEDYAQLHPTLQGITDSVKDTDALLTKMFQVESLSTGPTLEPESFVTPKVRGTNQDVAKEDQDTIREHQKMKHYIKDAQVNNLKGLSTDGLRTILGYRHDMDNVQENRKDSVNSSNRGINKSINTLNEFLETTGSGTPFYFKHDMMKNNRLLLVSNTLNPQADKLHRHMVKIQNQEATINLNDTDPTNENNFLIAFGQSMGIDIDKMLNSDSLVEVKELIETDVVQEAVKAINSKDGDFTPEQEAAILAAVKEGGEKAWSFDGLVGLAGYVHAKDNGEASYTHDLMVEADGITNGPAIGTIQFGIGNNINDIVARLKKVGINPKGDTQEFGEYISQPGSRDNYETITLELNKKLDSLDPDSRRYANFALFLLGDLVKVDPDTGKVLKINRNISKNPLMTTIYGAGKESIKGSVGKQVIDEVYKYLEKNVNEPEALRALYAEFNKTFGIKLDKEFGTKPLEYTLPNKVANRVRNLTGEALGTAMVEAIDEQYGQFKEGTQILNEGMGVVAETFQKMFKHAVEEKTKELVEQGVLAMSPKGQVLESLPKDEEQKILEQLWSSQPIMNSVMSANTGNVSEGLYVGKINDVAAVDNMAYQTRQSYTDSTYKSASMYGKIKEYISGGVSPVVLAVQNVDATTMLRHLKEKRSFNVYDAIITGVRYIGENTTNMNKHFYEISRDHSIATEALNAYERAEEAAKVYDAENGTSLAKEFLKNGVEFVDGERHEYSIKGRLIQEVSNTNRNKATVLSTIGQVGQYGWENSSHVVDTGSVDLVDSALGTVTDEDVITKSLGNTPLGDQGEFHTDSEKLVNSMTATEVFDELDKMGNVKETTEHKAYLRDSVNQLKAQLLEPVKLHISNVLQDTMAHVEGNDIYMYTQMFGGQKNSSAILNSGLRMSAVEAYAHELWHAVSRHGIEGNSKAKQALTTRWEQAKNTITPRDLMDDSTLPETSDEYAEAQKVWDYIFTPRNDLETTVTNPVTGSVQKKVYSNHLHEFAAFSMTNAKFIKALKNVPANAKTDKVVRTDDGSFLNNLFNKIMDILGSVIDKLTVQLTNTRGLPQDEAVRELVKQLSNIEGMKKNLLMSSMDRFNSTADKLTGLVGTVAKQIVKPVNHVANSQFVRDNKSVLIRLPGRLVRVANDIEKVSVVFDAMENAKRNLQAKKQNFGEQLFTEAKGLTENFKNFHSLSRLKTKMVDGAVVELQSNLITILNKAFIKTPPTEAESRAITKAYLKTDLSSLNLSMPQLITLLSSPTKVDKDIATLESRLANDPNFNHYLVQTKALGYYMTTGKVTSSNLNYNAAQIAQLFGTDKTNPNAAKVERIIDMITTLYALKYTNTSEKNQLLEFIKKNEATGSENGMTFLQAFHQKQKQTDKELNFAGSEINITKGYIKDEYDPNISAVILNDDEGLEYQKRGWIRTELMQDQADPANPVALYVDTHGGETRTISSIISFTSKQARGTDTVKRRQVLGSSAPIYEGGRDTAVIFAKKERAFKQQVQNAATFDPTKAETGMAPLYDLNGNVTGYRYLMREETKDRVLNRSNDAISVVAKGAGSTLNKTRSTEFNEKTIEALKQHFDKNTGGNFLTVGPDSRDPELKEIYARLPKETKQAIKDIWGKESMPVDRELLTMLFGYRKFSIADQLAQDKANQHIAIQFLGSVNSILGKPWNYSAEQVARSTGQYWQEYVSAAKDFLIIKSGVVTVINTISNSTQLYTAGLSIPETIKYQKEAVVEVSKYRQQMAELFELEKMVELGVQPNQLKQQEARIARLKSEITANPVTDVIEDGLLQNIVEDVNLIEDEFSKAGKLSRVLDKHVFTKLPGFVREVAKEATQSHDSFLYKKMSQSAQLSDFMARYALYQHNIKKGMARDDAANISISTFINYDLPTHRGIQYLNDMGFLWFTKYYIRIQKIIAKTLIDNPARVISLVTLDFMTGDGISTVQDTIATPTTLMNRVGIAEDPIDLLGNLAIANVL